MPSCGRGWACFKCYIKIYSCWLPSFVGISRDFFTYCMHHSNVLCFLKTSIFGVKLISRYLMQAASPDFSHRFSVMKRIIQYFSPLYWDPSSENWFCIIYYSGSRVYTHVNVSNLLWPLWVQNRYQVHCISQLPKAISHCFGTNSAKVASTKWWLIWILSMRPGV